jgi:hypothetical protein
MTTLFVFNGPLQYLLCRIIERCLGGDKSLGIQYLDCGDFSSVFREIDSLLGLKPLNTIVHRAKAEITVGEIDRVFYSNRFNQSEVELHLQTKRRARLTCAFEDGLSLYLSHCFIRPEWHDENYPLVLKNKAREIRRSVQRSSPLPDYFSASQFDEVYSIFPEVPFRHSGTRRISIGSPFKAALTSGEPSAESGALLLSQSLATDRFLSEEKYEAILHRLCVQILREHGSLYVKPHPRDPQGVLERVLAIPGCRLLPEEYRRVPAEIYIARRPRMAVYGFWSSTLAYSAGIFGARAYTFAPALVETLGNNALSAIWGSMGPILLRHGVTPYQIDV